MLVGLKRLKKKQSDGECTGKKRKGEMIESSKKETKKSKMNWREQYVEQEPFVSYDLLSDRKKEKTKEKLRETEDVKGVSDEDHQEMETEPSHPETVKSTTGSQINDSDRHTCCMSVNIVSALTSGRRR